MDWELVAFFGIFIAFVIVLIVLNFTVFRKISKETPASPTSPVPPKNTTTVVAPSSYAVKSPSPTNPTFRPAKVITSEGSNAFNFIISSGLTGYLTYRNERDLKKWGVDLPLNYTHVSLDGKIIELTNPSSSDSTGKVLSSPPANIQSNTIQFGMFF
jgi:hypothetical protein